MLLVFRFTILFSTMHRQMKLAYHITARLIVVGNANKIIYITLFLFHKRYIFDFSVCHLWGKGIKGQGLDYGELHVYSTL